MSDFKVSWSDSTLAMFRVLRGKMQKYGFMNVSLSMMLCTILQQTFVMSDYFVGKEVSDDDLNSVIKKRYHLNCSKVKSKFKIRIADDSERYSYAVGSAFVRDELNSQLFEARDFDGSVISLLLQSDLMEILVRTVVRAQESEIELVEPKHIIEAMFDEDCLALQEFFADLGLSYKEAKDHFAKDFNRNTFVIPEELSGMVSFLNNKVDINKPCEILGREEECNAVWNIMLKKENRHVLIVGVPGYGKTSLVEKLTDDIACGKSPKQFWGFDVISINVYSLISEISNSSGKIQTFFDFLRNRSHAIVFIDNIHELTVAQENDDIDVITPLNSLFSFDNVIVVGALDSAAYNEQFTHYDISSHFETVELMPVLLDDMYPMLRLKIQSLSEYHGVSISPEIAQFALKVAFNFFSIEARGFHSMMNLIDLSLSTAKIMGSSALTRSEILQSCHLSYYIWDSMPLDERKHIAIHEAGHYIVVNECSNSLNLKGSGISIIPFNGFTGMTFASVKSLAFIPCNAEYYISYIAYVLAGKVAEEIFGFKPDNGALSDLSKATDKAFEAIDSLDLLGISHRNDLYINSKESLPLSDESAKLMSKEAANLINQATLRAKYILEANKDVIEAIANALLENPVMIDDVNKIWQDTISKRTQASKTVTENNGKSIKT